MSRFKDHMKFKTALASAQSASDISVGRDAPVDDGYSFSGRHLIASYSGCDLRALRNVDGLMAAMRDAVTASGATLLKSSQHVFPPHGLTAVMLLSESHASIHTYPEHGSCFVDLFTCGQTCKAEAFDAVLRKYLRPKQSSQRILLRHDQTIDESLEKPRCVVAA